MLAQKLDAIPGVNATFAKGIIVLALAAVSGALMALVQDGTIAGPLATIMPFAAAFLTGVAALVDPNAGHAP